MHLTMEDEVTKQLGKAGVERDGTLRLMQSIFVNEHVVVWPWACTPAELHHTTGLWVLIALNCIRSNQTPVLQHRSNLIGWG